MKNNSTKSLYKMKDLLTDIFSKKEEIYKYKKMVSNIVYDVAFSSLQLNMETQTP